MIDSERGRSNTNVPFHLPDALEYKFLGCIPDHHQSRMVSNGIAMAGQDSDGGGEAQRKCVRCMQGVCGGFGTRRPSNQEAFREVASRGPLSLLLF